MRRNDHDVTDRVRTTDLQQVSAEVMRLYEGLYNGTPSGAIKRGFADIGRLYAGEHPDYKPCDTEYHDIQHVLDVTLAMARLMDSGADVNAANTDGRTALDAAKSLKYESVIKFLTEKGALPGRGGTARKAEAPDPDK